MHLSLTILPLASIAFASQRVFDDIVNLPHAQRNRTCSVEDEYAFLGLVRDPVCQPTPENVATKPAISAPSEPWTQPPSCIRTSDDDSHLYCIYTSSTFARGRGISLFTTPAAAKHLAQNAAFTKPEVLEGVNVESNPPYTVQPLPGRGMGVIANRTLHKGDAIFSYSPVIIIHRSAFEVFSDEDRFPFQHDAVDRLPARTRELFLGLHGHFGGDKVDDIVHTNSFQVDFGEDEEAHNVILPETSRINHDCRPNAHYYFDVNTLTHHVNAIQTVHAGEELTISYTDGSASRADRQAAIKLSWGFDCSCSLCTQRPAFTQASDKRLELIADLEKHLEDWTVESLATPEMAETVISLYKQERLHAPIAMAYTYAALAHNAVGHQQQAIKYAALSVETGSLNSGPEFSDVQAMKELIEDPRSHWSWNLRLSK